MDYLIPPSHRGISRPIQDRASRRFRRARTFALMLTTSSPSSSSATCSASACSNSSDSARGAALRNAEKIRSSASVAMVDCGGSSDLAASLNAVAPGVFRPQGNGCNNATRSNSDFYRRLLNAERRLVSIRPLSGTVSRGKPYFPVNHDCSPRAGFGLRCGGVSQPAEPQDHKHPRKRSCGYPLESGDVGGCGLDRFPESPLGAGAMRHAGHRARLSDGGR